MMNLIKIISATKLSQLLTQISNLNKCLIEFTFEEKRLCFTIKKIK